MNTPVGVFCAQWAMGGGGGGGVQFLFLPPLLRGSPLQPPGVNGWGSQSVS